MNAYLLKRLVGAISTALIVATLVFMVLRGTGDPATLLVGGEATKEQIALVQHRLGVDRPLPIQYLDFISGIFRGKMSPSFRYGQPAMELVFERIPTTFALAISAILLAWVLAFPLGLLSAIYRGSFFDMLASLLAFSSFAIPTFWLGTMLIIVFAVQLHLLPTSGNSTPQSWVLPTLTLAAWPMGEYVRLIRSEMLGVMREDYIRTARAKGLPEALVIVKHGLRNAILPIITMTGLMVGGLLGGAVVTETIFGLPGMGRLALEATLNRDFPVVEASVVFIAILYAGINFLVDVLYTVVDPRISYG